MEFEVGVVRGIAIQICVGKVLFDNQFENSGFLTFTRLIHGGGFLSPSRCVFTTDLREKWAITYCNFDTPISIKRGVSTLSVSPCLRNDQNDVPSQAVMSDEHAHDWSARWPPS